MGEDASLRLPTRPWPSDAGPLLTLHDHLLLARKSGDVIAGFRQFMQDVVPGSYVTLWYRDDQAVIPALLLADEFGSLHGGTVRPAHNRLLLGAGIVGAAAESGVIQRCDMAKPADLQRAASPELVTQEELLRVSAFPWPSSEVSPGGVVLIGSRERDWLSPELESVVVHAASQTLLSLIRLVRDRSRNILPNLIAELSALSSTEDILEAALRVVAPEFAASFGVLVCVIPHDYLAIVTWKPGEPCTQREVIPRPWGLDLRTLPKIVRLFHAQDFRDLLGDRLPEGLPDWLEGRLRGRVGRHDHVIAAQVCQAHQPAPPTGGILLLSRSAESLSFLPEESTVLRQASDQISLLVGLNRREELRNRVIAATADVALGADLALAIVSFFLSAEDLLQYRMATLVIERETDSWEAYSYSPDPADSRKSSKISSLTPVPLAASDPAVRAIDAVALAVLDHPADEIETALNALAGRLVPPASHRAFVGSSGSLVNFPLLFGRRVRGALFLTLPQGTELLTEQAHYLRTLAQQLATTWNVERLRGTEERFLDLVDRLDRLLSANLLSIGLSHETKGKLGEFSHYFNTVHTVAKRLANSPDRAVVADAGTLSAVANNGAESIRLLDEIASAISEALLPDDDDDTTSQGATALSYSGPPIYFNDIIRVYHKALKEVGRDEDGRLQKKVLLTNLSTALDRPKLGVGNPFSHDARDRIRLGQVVSNLVLNALDASPQRGRVELESQFESPNFATLVVRDFGVGMTEEVKVRLFEPFFSRRQGRRSGFGLGMVIVRSLVREMGGDLSFSTKPNAGTTFTVSFPLPVRRSVGRHGVLGNALHPEAES